ncbi:MAG: T9SS type A sorting domain-containing protein [Candidatus Eisenbacteria bacterium]|nr:T9SS type A sorting domain-containing protein [Candidatus Eisenbacteria bacterium]
MRGTSRAVAVLTFLVTGATGALAADTFSWRYYRLGNTGIQGDYNHSIWIGADGDPWIGGYDPIQEEGGVAKFIQSENRWLNVSNVDYPVIGSQYDLGVARVTDMLEDGQGNLWMGTWRGVLKMNLAAGPSSLVKYGPGNSALPGGVTNDLTRAPDGTIWVSASSSVWGGGGLTRYNPGTNSWTHINGHGGLKIAAQSKTGGGYYLWASGEGFSPMERWNSTTQTWNSYPATNGNPSHLVSLDSVDDAGNMWIQRWVGVQGEETLDCMRPDGTWISPPLPPAHPQVGVVGLRAFGNLQALLVNGYGDLYRFNGTSWTHLGTVPHNGFVEDLDIDAAGNIWLCGQGTGGAVRRDAVTGAWQRYRITNTSQFDPWNRDLAIDPISGDVFITANASPDYGGMVQFDGERWTCYVNDLGYGLSAPWPSDSPQSEAVYVRPSNGQVVANPLNDYTHQYDGASWTQIPGGYDQMEEYVEDSLGRLWAMGHYGNLGIFENGSFTVIDAANWSGRIDVDPSRPGTVWANQGWKIQRTDGSYSFSRLIEDFPELVPNYSQFEGLAAAEDGTCWVGANGGSGGVLYHINPVTGTHQVWNSATWPFPGDHVYPECVSPDGRVWMSYASDFPSDAHGMFWWDGVNLGIFPQVNGSFTGFPDGPLVDMEVKSTPAGYELWMCIIGRGVAVLSVETSNPTSVDAGFTASGLRLEQNWPNPLRSATRIAWTNPQPAALRLTVFDVAGRAVRRLLDGELPAGRHELEWDGTADDGRAVSSGVYFYRLEAGAESSTRKLTVR